MNLITLGLGGVLLVTLGLGTGIIPAAHASIPAGAIAAERGVRHADVSADRLPSISDAQRENAQASDRPAQLSTNQRTSSPTSRRRN